MASRSSIAPYLWRTPFLWLGASLLVIAFIFGAVGAAVAIQDTRFAADGATVEGIVLSKDVHHGTGSSGSSSTSYSIRYRFTLPSDQTYEGSSSIDLGDWDGLVERGPVTVQYLVSDPSSNRLPSSGSLINVIFLAIGVVVGGIGGFLIWRGWRTLREDRRLLRVGTEARATIAAVEPTRIRVNLVLQWVISYVYRDVAGKEHKGRSLMLPEPEAKKFRRGDHATIRYDPDRPAQSLWIHGAQPTRSASSDPKESSPLEHGDSPGGHLDWVAGAGGPSGTRRDLIDRGPSA